jgi:hypothetical protein
VRGDLSMLPGALLSTSAEQVPGVWVSPDHQCILWCNQLVVAVARALGDALTPTHNPPALPPRVQREGVVRRRLAPSLWDAILGRYRHTPSLHWNYTVVALLLHYSQTEYTHTHTHTRSQACLLGGCCPPCYAGGSRCPHALGRACVGRCGGHACAVQTPQPAADTSHGHFYTITVTLLHHDRFSLTP